MIARPDVAAACWLSMLAAFVALAGAAASDNGVAADVWLAERVQDLRGAPLAEALFDLAQGAGSFEAVAAVVAVLAVALAARGYRWQAVAGAGVVAMRLLQLAVRSIDGWGGGGALGEGYVTPGGGFPSGHVLGQVLVYGFLFAFAPRLAGRRTTLAVRAACLALVALGAAQRVYSGAHWPSEVLGGALLAGLYLLPVLRVEASLRVWQERRLARDAGLSAAAPSGRRAQAQPSVIEEPAAVPASV